MIPIATRARTAKPHVRPFVAPGTGSRGTHFGKSDRRKSRIRVMTVPREVQNSFDGALDVCQKTEIDARVFDFCAMFPPELRTLEDAVRGFGRLRIASRVLGFRRRFRTALSQNARWGRDDRDQ